jgi:hypothetical protein
MENGTQKPLAEQITGKEIHVRLLSNDLLEMDKRSLTVVGIGGADKAFVHNSALEKKRFTEYNPQRILGKMRDLVSGKTILVKEHPDVFVVIEEKRGNVSADDARYIEWLTYSKGERPGVIMLPEHDTQTSQAAQSDRPSRGSSIPQGESFWKRQFRRFIALPAPVTKDAAIAAIPRTLFPIILSILLAYIKRNEVTALRVGTYIGVSTGITLGFSLFNQTIMNWMTFWSEFTSDALEPLVDALERWRAALEKPSEGNLLDKSSLRRKRVNVGITLARYAISLFSFISARGDVVLGGPLLGIGTLFAMRLALGPIGQTASVLTVTGFLLMLENNIVGNVTGGPYIQVLSHLRAVGKISNRASLYLGIFDELRMQVGKLSDFGFQILYHVVQVMIAVVCWIMLLICDRFYRRPEVHCLERQNDIEFVARLLNQLRARDDIKEALVECTH